MYGTWISDQVGHEPTMHMSDKFQIWSAGLSTCELITIYCKYYMGLNKLSFKFSSKHVIYHVAEKKKIFIGFTSFW